MIDPSVFDLLSGTVNQWRHHRDWHLGFSAWEQAEIRDGRLPRRFEDEERTHAAGDYWYQSRYDERLCATRGHDEIGLGVVIAENGRRDVREHCLTCGWQTGARNSLPHRGIDISALPVIRDNRASDWAVRCERCGAPESEMHHWAPRHLFDDADSWPTSMLCPSCHREWHRIVTPHMGQRAS